MKNKLSFRKLVATAADLLTQISGLESQRKLSPGGFMAEALGNASCTLDRLVEIDRLLSQSKDCDAIIAFVRKLYRAFREDTYVRPFRDSAKAIGVFSKDEAACAAQLAGLGITTLEAVALAARQATTRHPKSFGTIEDFDLHTGHIEELRENLKSVYQQMQSTVSGADLIFDQSRLSNEERDKGLCHVTFRNYSRIKFGPDWCVRIVGEEIRNRAKKIKTLGEKAVQKALEISPA